MSDKAMSVIIDFANALFNSVKCIELNSNGTITQLSPKLAESLEIKDVNTILGKNIATLSNEFYSQKSFILNNEKRLSGKKIFTLVHHSKSIFYRITFFTFNKNSGIHYFGVCHDVSQLIVQNELLDEKRKKIEAYTSCLIELAKDKSIYEGNFNKALEKITTFAAFQMNVSRISVWAYNKELDAILCSKLFEKDAQIYSDGTILYARDFPLYFKAVRAEKVIDAAHARTHEETKEYTDVYLIPLNIYSMLDVPYFIDGVLGGIICCEQQGAVRDWDGEDILFVKSMTDIVSIAYKGMLKKQDEEQIRRQKNEIELQNTELREQRDYINKVNQSLEMLVHEKNAEVIKKDSQITEYAFINSHLLRSPLSSIKGLVELLEQQSMDDASKEILLHLKKASNDLDHIIVEITNTLKEKPDKY